MAQMLETHASRPVRNLVVAHPPAEDTVLYDGHCRFCVGSSRLLARLTGARVQMASFREEGVLERFAPLDGERCERAMQYVRTDGRVFQGAEAAVQALQHRFWGRLALVYYLPGLRQLSDALYDLIARHRFRLAGRACPDGTCHLHVR